MRRTYIQQIPNGAKLCCVTIVPINVGKGFQRSAPMEFLKICAPNVSLCVPTLSLEAIYKHDVNPSMRRCWSTQKTVSTCSPPQLEMALQKTAEALTACDLVATWTYSKILARKPVCKYCKVQQRRQQSIRDGAVCNCGARWAGPRCCATDWAPSTTVVDPHRTISSGAAHYVLDWAQTTKCMMSSIKSLAAKFNYNSQIL